MKDSQSSNSETESISLVRCTSNALIFAAVAFGLYKVTTSIAHTFASKPVHSDNYTVIQMSAAIRTLVVSIFTLGTGVFTIAAVGLTILALQVSFQRLFKGSTPPSDV